MRTQNELSHHSRHYLPGLDNHILVENHGGGVVIHASRDNFSEQRKASFIRHLAAEGHIADRYEWFSEPREKEFFNVRWVVDCSWSESDPQIERRARRRELGVMLLGFAVFLMLRWWVSPHGYEATTGAFASGKGERLKAAPQPATRNDDVSRLKSANPARIG